MKKHLIAAAVAGALAVPAMAQVTVYGRLDAGYRDTETKTAANTKEVTGLDYSPFTSSRFGVKGEEDLGGGLKAGFTIEGGIDDEIGSTGSTEKSAFGFGRHQFLTLSGGFGSILVGKTDSLGKQIFDTYDAGFSNNIDGAYDSFGGSEGVGYFFGNRRDQVIRYTSPAMSGISVTVGMMDQTTDNSQFAGQTEDNNGYEFGTRYAAGPISLAVAYRDTDSKTEATATDAATAQSAKTTAFGASYNLGMALVSLMYFDGEGKSGTDKVEGDGTVIGVRIPMGSLSLFASFTDAEEKYSEAGVQIGKIDQEGYQVGAKYDLSKRTYAYFVLGDREEKAGTAKTEVKDMALGIAHSF